MIVVFLPKKSRLSGRLVNYFSLNNANAYSAHIGRPGVIGAGNLFTASAEKPQRTGVREDFEHCPGAK
jgi:hypothetical protein